MDKENCTIMSCPVQPPKCERALHGILDCANIIEVPAGDKRLNGVSFSPQACGRGYVWQPGCTRNEECEPVCDETGEPVYKQVDGVCEPEEFAPFTAYGTFKCSTISYQGDYNSYRTRALNALEGTLSKSIEEFLWQGYSTVCDEEGNPLPGCVSPCATFFGESAGEPLCSEPMDACAGLALLIQFLASCGEGQRGMIHAPPIIVNAWLCCGLIECVETAGFDGQRVEILRTKIGGHCVVAGAGYTGNDPDGECVPGGGFAYATRCMDLYLGPAFVPQENLEQAIHTATNDVIVYAERTVVAAFDSCCVAGLPLLAC